MKELAGASKGAGGALPRWLLGVLSAPLGGLLGAAAFYAGAIAAFGLGMFSSYGIGRYWWQLSLVGGVFGLLQGPLSFSLRKRGSAALLLSGTAAFIVWMPISLARGSDPSMPVRMLKNTVGMSLILGASAVLTAYWTVGALNALERGAFSTRRSHAVALCVIAVGLGAAGFFGGLRRHREAAAPKLACLQFARAFAAGDLQTALGMFSYAPGGRVTPAEARYWFAKAVPFLPVGGQTKVVRWRYAGPDASWCMCRVRVVGATYHMPAGFQPREAEFDVRVGRSSEGWTVEPPELALETYLASLYGKDAGRSWQRFLLTTKLE